MYYWRRKLRRWVPLKTSIPGAVAESVHELRDPDIYVEDGIAITELKVTKN
jgi:hypothetical protein